MAEPIKTVVDTLMQRLRDEADRAYVEWRGEPKDGYDKIAYVAFEQGYIEGVFSVKSAAELLK